MANFNFRIQTEYVLDAIQATAKAQGMTERDLIMLAISEYCGKHGHGFDVPQRGGWQGSEKSLAALKAAQEGRRKKK